MKLLKTCFSVFILLGVLLAATQGVCAAKEYSWYCKRTSDHSQPPVGGDISFVEEYGGYCVDKNHGDNSEEKIVYLTFDAGYENGNVEKILDVMKKQNVTGAFFILGNLVEKNSSLVIRMANEGHLVCNHTYSHKKMAGKTREEFCAELQKLENKYSEITGRSLSKYYRPPEGCFDEDSLRYAQEMGYKTVFWSFAYADWDNNHQMSREAAKKKILDNIHNGAVILLHPTSATNAAILEDVIVELKSQGYSFGSLDNLCTEVADSSQ